MSGASRRRVVAILNPAAGQGEPVLSTLNQALDRPELEWEARVTTAADDARRFAREAAEAGADLVLAYGGDGTQSEVATGLAGSGVPLAILPGGTGNSVGQELGIPTDLAAALELALDPRSEVRELDALRRGERLYLLRLGVRADARAVAGADREAKDKRGWFAYLSSALSRLDEVRAVPYRIELDGRAVELEACTVIVANVSRMGRGGMHLAHEVDPRDGLADVLVVRDLDAASTLAVGASMLGLTGPEEVPDGCAEGPFHHWRARRVRIEPDPPQPVHGDGDPIEGSPVEVALVPAAVRVVLPREPNSAPRPLEDALGRR